jgi:DASS family divalent anion:Na+ symporter
MPADESEKPEKSNLWLKWLIVAACALGVALCPVPEGIKRESWILLAIFAATIVGSIVRPVPAGAMVLIGVAALPIFGALSVGDALKGYADPVVWLVLIAFFLARGMIKTGLGRRIALVFVRAIGHKTLGLGYALVFTDGVLSSIIPSNGARNGGIVLPIARSVAETYDSTPEKNPEKLGTFLMNLLYQCDVIFCATFLTGQASNVIIAKFAQQTAGIEITYARWFVGAMVPAAVSLTVVPLLIYRFFPPSIKHTPAAAEMAAAELKKMGRMSRNEWLMLLTFLCTAALWIAKGTLHNFDTTVVALIGIVGLLVSNVLSWQDLIEEKAAWEVFIWYGGLVNMAGALGETGLTKLFAESAAGFTTGWQWSAALAALVLIYFYSHYAFASITAHVTAMFIPFLTVSIAAGAPPFLAVLLLAYFSNLNASVTHYGTTSGAVYFGSGYVRQGTWWTIGFLASIANILIWTVFGLVWWKILGWW